MKFINLFKYNIKIAKVIKIINKSEYNATLYKFEPYDPFLHPEHYRDIEYDEENETHMYVFDYTLLVEFKHKKQTYQSMISLNNSLNFISQNTKILIYYERKNPSNTYAL